MIQRQARNRVVVFLTLMSLLITGMSVILALPETGFCAGETQDVELKQKLPGLSPYLIADIADEVSPAVVYIQATWPADKNQDEMQDPFFRFFFGDRFPLSPWSPEPRQKQSAGTGFIISEEGYVLTNEHVVGAPGQNQEITVKITTQDFEKQVTAELVGSDYKLDLAVLKIDKPHELAKLPTVDLGDSDASRPGEWVIAIGNPYGEQLEHTVTVGVLSAKGRKIDIPDFERQRYRTYENLMQTDAAINPGNSGGPLINLEGKVIGINTAINAQAQGIGFAIPINTARDVVDELIETGGVQREAKPWLGVWLYNEITDRMQSYFDLPDKQGAMISEVYPRSPAYEAELRTYDVIRKVDDIVVQDADHLVSIISEHKVGDRIAITVIRNGKRIFVPVTLAEKPADMQ